MKVLIVTGWWTAEDKQNGKIMSSAGASRFVSVVRNKLLSAGEKEVRIFTDSCFNSVSSEAKAGAQFCFNKKTATAKGIELSTVAGPKKGSFLPKTLAATLAEKVKIWQENNFDVVITLGSLPTWFVSSGKSFSKHHGYILSDTNGFRNLLPIASYVTHAYQHDEWDRTNSLLINCVQKLSTGEDFYPERTVIVLTSPSDLRVFLRNLATESFGETLLGVDIETSKGAIESIAFSPSNYLSIVLNFVKDGKSFWEESDEIYAWKLVRDILANDKFIKIFQNGNYDCYYLFKLMGFKVTNWLYDTLLLEASVNSANEKNLGALGARYCNVFPWKHIRSSAQAYSKEELK